LLFAALNQAVKNQRGHSGEGKLGISTDGAEVKMRICFGMHIVFGRPFMLQLI
jgi:hypothetical protein